MGIADTVAPNSDQLDAVDLLRGPQTFTVTRVVVNKGAEQPVAVHFAEFPRPWKPGKNMRRVLIGVWGGDEQEYVGRRITLFCETRVKYAGEEVGGSRISHMSHITETTSVPVIPTRGKSATYKVKPLIESAPAATIPIASCNSIDELRGMWEGADAQTQKLIEARVAALQSPAADVAVEG